FRRTHLLFRRTHLLFRRTHLLFRRVQNALYWRVITQMLQKNVAKKMVGWRLCVTQHPDMCWVALRSTQPTFNAHKSQKRIACTFKRRSQFLTNLKNTKSDSKSDRKSSQISKTHCRLKTASKSYWGSKLRETLIPLAGLTTQNCPSPTPKRNRLELTQRKVG
ncbi:hypothetical protein, partial [uncultured Nostoc sp.]|uniref:hypothetical protein n=1 Tax=uncultured Nostoc sp. TaxID=340711 RepID=UPI0035CAB1FF